MFGGEMMLRLGLLCLLLSGFFDAAAAELSAAGSTASWSMQRHSAP